MTTTTTSSSSYLDSLRSSSSTAKTSTKGSSTIDQAGFLKLLTAQMSNQDPTSPMDSSTMVQQLSTMSQTSGITEMNASLKSLVSATTGNRIGDAASWIGKAALVQTGIAQPLANGGFAGQVTLPSAASSVSVDWVDASGTSVHSETLSNQKAGAIDVSWDGKKSDGTAASGPLKLVVSAVGGTGGVVTPTVATWSTVTGVNSPAGGSSATLSTTLGTVSPTDVLSLS